MADRYNIRETEEKWRKVWDAKNVFHVTEDSSKPKYYVLEMFPYPSGRIHMGHVRNYSLGDVVARYRTARGFNVLHPMGWDAFGLPAENAAIERGAHPKDWTYENIAAMRVQLEQMGLSLDWGREVTTCSPAYYKHEQKMFLDFLKKGLAYRREMMVNWDPVDNTVLANEQVIDGKGWRTGAPVERRKLNQWSLKITAYAEELLEAIKGLDRWPEKVRIMQDNWIGKSQGLKFTFDVFDHPHNEQIDVFTTRPDTLFGASFAAVSPDHPFAQKVGQALNGTSEEFNEFMKNCQAQGTSEASIEQAEKLGFNTGWRVVHPFFNMGPYQEKKISTPEEYTELRSFVDEEVKKGNLEPHHLNDKVGQFWIDKIRGHIWELGFNERGNKGEWKIINPVTIPVYIANFVLMDYGTGAIFGCPAHDQRDFEFATKYGLAITQVVAPTDGSAVELPFTDAGIAIQSDFLNGLTMDDAKAAAIAKMESLGRGQGVTQYRLRDWGISRQRYWGCPIPIVHCDACGVVPVPEDQLPVELPYDVTFDKPGNPLEHHPTWKHTTCPSCGKTAKRETDTFDTFFESSWYFARYTDPNNTKIGFAKEKASYWLPVDQYIGGVEHAVLHLLYSRFFTRALSECGYMDTPEPFAGLYTQGMINHLTFKDKDGKWVYPKDVMKDEKGNWVMVAGNHEPVTAGRVEKMSKSKRNTIDPQDILDTYGADAARLFILSDSPPDRDLEWTESGLDGAWRFVNRLHRLVTENKDTILSTPNGTASDGARTLQQKAHQTIAKVADDIEAFHMNKAVARLRELTNMIEAFKPESGDVALYREAIEFALRGLNPMIPHITEELWSELGNTTLLVQTPWPTVNPDFLKEDSVTIGVQINGKLKATITLPIDAPQEEAEKIALSEESVIRALEGKSVRKVIVVPNRIVNVVAG